MAAPLVRFGPFAQIFPRGSYRARVDFRDEVLSPHEVNGLIHTDYHALLFVRRSRVEPGVALKPVGCSPEFSDDVIASTVAVPQDQQNVECGFGKGQQTSGVRGEACVPL